MPGTPTGLTGADVSCGSPLLDPVLEIQGLIWLLNPRTLATQRSTLPKACDSREVTFPYNFLCMCLPCTIHCIE